MREGYLTQEDTRQATSDNVILIDVAKRRQS